ncbi:MAG: GAF domain-containing protein [Pseudanabaenaceae cyanobacterium bins.39]|nr:GAF domain-containing protein [Pseudanabaenaceae cyanobacterium bins.39]
MHKFLSSPELDIHNDNISNLDDLATDMFNSHSIEELVRRFVLHLGKYIECDRIAICRKIDPQQVQVLTEAISPKVCSIKNQVFPTSCFGISSLQSCTHDQIFTINDTAKITETLAVQQYWQETQIRAIMCAPILFDNLETPPIKQSWGLAMIQSFQPRAWLHSERQIFLQITQILSQCLQYWQLRLDSQAKPKYCTEALGETFSKIEEYEDLDFTRINLEQNSETSGLAINLDNGLSEESETINATEITPEIHISSDLANLDLTGGDSPLDLSLNRANLLEGDVSLMETINLAMQQWETYHPKLDTSPDLHDIDWDSNTSEDVLESLIEEYTESNTSRAEYLREKVKNLVSNLQAKMDEIAKIKLQIHELVTLQESKQLEFRQILENLCKEDY